MCRQWELLEVSSLFYFGGLQDFSHVGQVPMPDSRACVHLRSLRDDGLDFAQVSTVCHSLIHDKAAHARSVKARDTQS